MAIALDSTDGNVNEKHDKRQAVLSQETWKASERVLSQLAGRPANPEGNSAVADMLHGFNIDDGSRNNDNKASEKNGATEAGVKMAASSPAAAADSAASPPEHTNAQRADGHQADAHSDKTNASDDPNSLSKTRIDDVARQYGVQYDTATNPDGSTVRNFYVQTDKGEKIAVLSSDKTDPTEIDKQLRDFRDQKQQQVEQSYNVQISQDNTFDDPLGQRKEVRAPHIDELFSLERGLNHSQPSTITANGKPVGIIFAKEKTSDDDGYTTHRADGQQLIVFENNPRNFRDLEDTVLHEFTHNGQNNLGLWKPQESDDFYKQIGYKQIQTTDKDGNAQTEWLLEGKDGKNYVQSSDQFPFGKWTEVDDQGRPLKKDGTLAASFTDPEANQISNDDARKVARVTPASDYFSSGVEDGAETMRFYRGDEESRAELHRTSPALYSAAKQYDQLEIDTVYGTNADGSAKYIRLPDGRLGENNAANQQQVMAYEESLSTPMPPEHLRRQAA